MREAITIERVERWFSDFGGLIDFFDLNEEFNEIIKSPLFPAGRHYVRGFFLFQCLKHLETLEGDVAEVGVYRGKTARIMAKTTKKPVYLFDTFKGMPPSDPVDFYKEGDMGDTSLDMVRAVMLGCNNAFIYPGFFPDTAKHIEDKKFSFVHVDCDIYRSVMDCCIFFYPRMVKGGMIVFDDPGFDNCAGAKKAVDEFFSDKEEFPIYLVGAQVLVIKI